MKRLFISQPMRDKSNAEILAERNKAIEVASKQLNEEVEVIDSFFKDSPALTNPLLCLEKQVCLEVLEQKLPYYQNLHAQVEVY